MKLKILQLTKIIGKYDLLVVSDTWRTLQLCSACACGCVWSAAGARLGGAGAGAAAVRATQLGAITSLLLHGALLTMRLTALHLLMPIDWNVLVRYSGIRRSVTPRVVVIR